MPIDVAGPLESDHRWVLRAVDRAELDVVEAELGDALERIAEERGGMVQLWLPEVDEPADAAARVLGFEPYRDLWQLRVALPTPRTELPTRSFDADRDLEDFLGVNARAFAWHPEQGQLTEADVRAAMAAPWFDADGFRLHHRDGVLAGFCWTKIHADHDPPLGEIYAIAVDPAFRGQGLGMPMTQAGLDHLADRGLEVAMLYVESDNRAANRVYEQLGFAHHHTDRAYQLELS